MVFSLNVQIRTLQIADTIIVWRSVACPSVWILPDLILCRYKIVIRLGEEPDFFSRILIFLDHQLSHYDNLTFFVNITIVFFWSPYQHNNGIFIWFTEQSFRTRAKKHQPLGPLVSRYYRLAGLNQKYF